MRGFCRYYRLPFTKTKPSSDQLVLQGDSNPPGRDRPLGRPPRSSDRRPCHPDPTVGALLEDAQSCLSRKQKQLQCVVGRRSLCSSVAPRAPTSSPLRGAIFDRTISALSCFVFFSCPTGTHFITPSGRHLRSHHLRTLVLRRVHTIHLVHRPDSKQSCPSATKTTSVRSR